jgi:putative hydrolase of the HAD superfamily
MLQGILFDLGDTLLDFEPMDTRQVFRDGARLCYERLKSRLPRSLCFDDYCRRQFRSVRWAYFWSKLSGREFDSLALMCRNHARWGIALDPATCDQMMWNWYESLLRHASIADDVIPTLQNLRDHGLKLGLVSNTFIPAAIHDRHLREAGLIDLLPVRVYSSHVRYRKPHPQIFRIALQQLGTPAAATLFVGDMPKADILGAKGVGMKTALRRGRAGNNHQGAADHVIRNVCELLDLAPVVKPPGPSPQAPALRA